MDNNIDQILEKYWQGESSLQEEQILKEYFASGDIDTKHAKMAPMFGYFKAQQEVSYDHNLSEVLRDRLSKEGSSSSDSSIMPALESAKVFTLKRVMLSVAAIFALVMTAIVLFQSDEISIADDAPIYASHVIVLDGQEDSEEALKITREALAFLSGKLSKSSVQVNEGIQNLDKMNVIN